MTGKPYNIELAAFRLFDKTGKEWTKEAEKYGEIEDWEWVDGLPEMLPGEYRETGTDWKLECINAGKEFIGPPCLGFVLVSFDDYDMGVELHRLGTLARASRTLRRVLRKLGNRTPPYAGIMMSCG